MTRNLDYMKSSTWWAARVKHGGYSGGKERPEHYVWRTMLARCLNKNSKNYASYGGRGITVCKRWMDYKNFIVDMGERPAAGYSLDRINNDGAYKPSNCRWATRSTQQTNKSSTRFYRHGKTTDTLVGWAQRLGMSKELAHWRFKTWGTFEKGKAWRELQKTR